MCVTKGFFSPVKHNKINGVLRLCDYISHILIILMSDPQSCLTGIVEANNLPKIIADPHSMLHTHLKIVYAIDPMVYVVEGFLSDQECQEFITLSKDRLNIAGLVGLDHNIAYPARTNKVAFLKHDENEMLHETSKRFSILVQMPIINAEQYHVLHYDVGNEYKPHLDTFDIETVDGKNCLKDGGQRMITAIAYLNNVEAGGTTFFPELGICIKPKKGNVLVFHNCLPDSTTRHLKSLHAGMPVESGEKWAVNLFFRENPNMKPLTP
jgi:prolyl 4-hydroxylase